jgi:hypothetical protein
LVHTWFPIGRRAEEFWMMGGFISQIKEA